MDELTRRKYDQVGLRIILSSINDGLVGFAQWGDYARKPVNRLLHQVRLRGAPSWRDPDMGMWRNHERVVIIWLMVKNATKIIDLWLGQWLDKYSVQLEARAAEIRTETELMQKAHNERMQKIVDMRIEQMSSKRPVAPSNF